jgi:AraC-like DNA-binding protein
MARPAKETASPSALAPALLRYVAARGADAAAVARCAGIELPAADTDEMSITPSALGTLLDAAADRLGEPHLGLRLVGDLPWRRYDAVAMAARAASTPNGVFQAMGRFAALLFPRLEAQVETSESEVRWSARMPGHPRGLGLHVDEYVVSFALAHVRRGGPVVPLRAWLISARPPALEPLVFALGTSEISFGAATTGLALASADAGRPLPGTDPILEATAEHMASLALRRSPRSGALADVVATHVEARLTSGAGAEAIAQCLHMSARTLQRRLEDEGQSLSAIVLAVRERTARTLILDATLPLAEVAYRVGFSDLATFSRAFKRWTGLPPGAFRRRAQPR